MKSVYDQINAIKSTGLLLLLVTLAGQTLAQGFVPIQINTYFQPGSTTAEKADHTDYKSLEQARFSMYQVKIKHPFRLGKNKHVLIPEFSYKAYFQDITHWPYDNTTSYDNNQQSLNLTGIFSLHSHWKMMVTKGVMKGYNSDVTWSDADLLSRYGAGVLYTTSSDHTIGLTVVYSQALNFTLPVFIFRSPQSAANRWNYSIAFPRQSTISYALTEKLAIQAKEALINGRYNILKNEAGVTSIGQTGVHVTMGVQYRVAGPVYASLDGGIAMRNRINLFDHDNVSIDNIEMRLQPAISAHIFVKIKND